VRRKTGIKILIAVTIFAGLFFLLSHLSRPIVWISEDSRIVLFEHSLFAPSPYLSPFAAHGSVGSRGYMVDEEGEITYFFFEDWRNSGLMPFFDRYSHFGGSPNGSFTMRNYIQDRRMNRITLDINGELIILNRATQYSSPLNTFMWLPGLETLHGVWETKDGRLRLDLTKVNLEFTDRRRLFDLIIPSRLPRFHGVYDPSGENIGLLISGFGGWAPHEGKFSITISENGNLRGHSFWRIGEGREMRADATFDGDMIRLDTTNWQTNPFRCDWYLGFPTEFTLHRVSY